jgi:hypothetical protein
VRSSRGPTVALIVSVAFVAALGMNRVAVALVLVGVPLLVWNARRRTSSKALLRSVAVVVAIGFGFGLMDVVLRVAANPVYAWPEGKFGLRWPTDPRLTKMRGKKSFEGEVFGDLARMSGVPAHRRLRKIKFTTDRLGFRNDGFPDSPVDLIVLGDSFGLGVGTTQAETLAVQLARLRGCRTYNLSFIGSPWHELVRLKTELPHIPVRKGTTVLWLLFSGNDLTEKYRPGLEVAKPRGALLRALTRYESFRRSSPVRKLIGSLTKHRSSRIIERQSPDGLPLLFYRKYIQCLSWTAEDVRAHKNFPRLREVVTEMKRFCSAQGLSLAIAVAPTKPEVYRWILESADAAAPPGGFAKAVADLCSPLGIVCLDLMPPFRAEAKRLDAAAGELLWWHDDTHWNARGHALAAECIHRELLR